ncbi:MAG: universal stress protein [Halobellus sp.]
MTLDPPIEVGRILVPVDGSESAMPALEHALSLANETGASVHILAVIDHYRLSSLDERKEVETDLENAVSDAAAIAQDAGVAVRTAVESGFPHETILEYVDHEGIDLIAMGTHGRTGLNRYLLGSVAEKVVRLSPVPVLAVRPEAAGERPYRDVVVPTDGSDAAIPAERWGVGLAARFGAAVHAVSVVPEEPVRSSETKAAYEDAAEEAVERVRRVAEEAGVGIDGAVEHGVPHREILDFADRTGADLLVVGTHGRTGVERFVLGSVAEKVVRLSETPVLVVPSE